MILNTFQVSTDHYEKNSQWKLLGVSSERKKTEYENDDYIHININITISRQSKSQVTYISNSSLGIVY